ncbi:hypothetical protein VII00023_17006 [Vibrio ichthyoenteri ATCC 700023]|uniref:Uncharacterized protein n=1 Tax=Vibrio ichthyoenteri ATCC 700023 TaxID=870968 RepID=F9S1J6_9VIBR|nr:hypothetical protein VII00023_17006 [Vibrio ichthyoenteri ATCC 700023]
MIIGFCLNDGFIIGQMINKEKWLVFILLIVKNY